MSSHIQQQREFDHYVTYTLASGQQGHIVLRTPPHPSDRLLRDALSNYGLDPSDIKKVTWVPVPSVRQLSMFQHSQEGRPRGGSSQAPMGNQNAYVQAPEGIQAPLAGRPAGPRPAGLVAQNQPFRAQIPRYLRIISYFIIAALAFYFYTTY